MTNPHSQDKNRAVAAGLERVHAFLKESWPNVNIQTISHASLRVSVDGEARFAVISITPGSYTLLDLRVPADRLTTAVLNDLNLTLVDFSELTEAIDIMLRLDRI